MSITESIRDAVAQGDHEAVRRIAATGDIITPRDDKGWLLRIASTTAASTPRPYFSTWALIPTPASP